MKSHRLLAALAVTLASVALLSSPTDVEAKRLGGGRPAGMQRQMPAKPANTATPAQQAPNAAPQQAAQPAQAAPQAQPSPGMAQAAPKRNWLGPVAGLAAGLGLAALASHFGFGDALAQGMTMVLLAVVAFVVIGWLMRRFAGGGATASPQPATAGAGAGGGTFASPTPVRPAAAEGSMAREAQQVFGGAASAPAAAAVATAPVAASALPPGFDAEGFTRIVKMIFIRMQAANDAGNVDDLRKFTTPELFASLRLDLQERGPAAQQTDVEQLDAELVDTAQEGDQWVASVRFSGRIREEAGQPAQPFQELWHLVKPAKGEGEWAIAGITPLDH